MSVNKNEIENQFYSRNQDNTLFEHKEYTWHDTLNSKIMPVLEIDAGEGNQGIILRACIDVSYFYCGEYLYEKYKSILIDAEEIKSERKGKRKFRLINGHEEEIIELARQMGLVSFELNDINIPVEPKGISADGFIVICPRCEGKFKHADRCPDCGQLIKY
ncbi:MAG: hypothetical protein E7272_08865 [Pseudobutyrivibrio ruminis]|uniref:Uncharacterized protein n=1 Tax=Pseudobutyrivibrio ruminis TaxID=46206 RepID=A0A927UD68_9FIRM|nr:hypothetical protein [Pseudobutyrivibrio ruminis]